MKTILLLALTTSSLIAQAEPQNLLRNGSFEGGTLYWHQVSAPEQTLVKDGAVGEYALRIAKGNVMSAPFVAERGQAMTVSFFVKGEKPGRVGVQMPPSAREPGTKAKRLWMREAEQSAEITTEWKRVSFTWNADVPQDGFWPFPHYLVQIGGYDSPIVIDGVTVVRGKEGTPAYVGRREIEVVSEVLNLPGYREAGNVFDRNAEVKIAAHVTNTTDKPQNVMLRLDLYDYDGRLIATADKDGKVPSILTKRFELPAGKTVREIVPVKLTANGCILVRTAARILRFATETNNDTGFDSCDLPITSLPYPKAATKPDFRERFGGSFAGREAMLQKYQRIGFGWTRWFPETKWQFFQLKKDAPFDWHDADFELAARYGVSQHVVLYGWPEGLMDKEHSGQPLPLDMKWSAEDARWDDLSIETAWDKFVKAAAGHFRGKSIIFEIENEPEFDKWDKFHAEYAKFTIRTAKLIRGTDPKAKIMVNNVYGIPSPVNVAFFKAGGLKWIDVVSWHDYHEGWLSDAQGIKRMRQNMDEAGGKNVELWFNEGWAFTNTAVDEPIACTHLTSAQSTNAIMASTVEMTIAGQEKTILFHTGYEDHGQSFWDYSGPGTLLWDWYGYPLPLVSAWNVLSHHIGISERVGFVRPPGANLAIFQDLRNNRGVIVAYADRDANEDVVVEFPFTGLTNEDNMGNATPLNQKLTLSKTGRCVFLYDGKTTGVEFLKKLDSLDRKNASFASTDGTVPTWNLPPTWEGKTKGESEGSIAQAEGKPIWKLEQLWPADWKKRENFRPMVWTGTDWNVKDGGFGGQPGASLKDGALGFGTRAPHGPDSDRHLRTAGLTFIAPKAGTYALHGTVSARMWDSNNKTTLLVLKKSGTGVEKVGALTIPHEGQVPLEGQSFALVLGDELTLLPEIDGMFAGGDCKLRDLFLTLGAAGAPTPGYRLPAAWEGTEKGGATGNPITAAGKPIWRVDRLWPEDAIMTANYSPMIWEGTRWTAPDHTHGGHPSVEIENGTLRMAAMGPWNGGELNFAKIPTLAFIAPANGIYLVTGTGSAKPWEGDAKTFLLSLRKKDTQRASEVTSIELPRDGTPQPFSMEVELNAGHELLFVPMMQGLHHNAVNFTIEGLTVSQK